MIFQIAECLNVLQNSEKGSNIAKIWGNEENLAIFTITLMAAFGSKNVHIAVQKFFTMEWRK